MEVAEVESLRQHLSADEDVYLTLAEVLDDLCLKCLALGGVTVQSCNSGTWEECCGLLFDPLRTCAEAFQRPAALVAASCEDGLVAAVMAGHTAFLTVFVKAQTYVAVRTFRNLAAFLALEGRSPRTAGAQDHNLTSFAEGALDVLNQLA